MKLNFLFDENMPLRLAQGLELIDQENKDANNINVHVYHMLSQHEQGLDDKEVVRTAKKLNAIIVSEDEDFKTIAATKQLVKELKIGVIIYKPPKRGIRYWERSLAIINAWEDIKEKVRNLSPPFLIRVDKDGKVFQEHF